ncbi:MAG: molybdopterin oxidoreductase family protein [Saprospiraceae bacterium]|nr:molybdopterin oxidoreductase family protein [Saprospiraceae bacterium]
MKVHYRTCHLCEAMCGLRIETDCDQVVKIEGDKEDVYSKGHICPKGVALQDIHNDPDRLKYPMRRKGAEWERISWAEAFDEVETKLNAIRDKHGPDALGLYMGNPGVHNTGTGLFFFDFAKALGTKNRFASHSLDQLPQMFVNGEMFGHQAMFPVPDLDRTSYFLALGANPLVSNGSIMSTPDIQGKLKNLQARGGKFVVIDPRKTRSAKLADEHHFIRPGSDVLFLLAFLNTVFDQQLLRLEQVKSYTDGIEEVEELCQPYVPELVAPLIGIEATAIRQIVQDFCGAEQAICYGRLGVSVQAYGSLCHWLINTINILTGNIDKAGGVMFPRPAMDFVKLLKHEAKAFRWKSRVRGLPEVASDLPSTVMAEEMLTPGEGQIKAMITLAGNPVLSAPNSRQLDQAFSQLEYQVAIDIYLNETTRHADIILPPATALEVLHYDFVLNIVALRNVANFSAPVFSINSDQRYDWQIILELQKRLERGNSLLLGLKHRILSWLTPERRINLGLRLGPYGLFSKHRLSLRKLKANPHGLDFGPLQPALPSRLFTKNKRINLAFPRIVEDLQRIPGLIAQLKSKSEALLLIGRRDLRSNNSWMHNSIRLVKGPNRCTLLIHPKDATERQLEQGCLAQVSSSVGQIKLSVEISEDIMPGVVSIPHGWGHKLKGTKIRVAEQKAGVNVNELTSEQVVDAPTGNAVLNAIAVQVRPVRQDQQVAASANAS